MEVIVKKGSRKNLGRPKKHQYKTKKYLLKISKMIVNTEINLQKLYLVTLKEKILTK